MITFFALNNRWNIPSEVDEITMSQYLRICETQNINEQISILTGLPTDVELDVISMHKLQQTCDYFTHGIELPPTDLEALDMQEQPFAAVYFCQQALATLPKTDALIFMLCYIYAGEDWTKSDRPKLHESNYDKYANMPAWRYLPLLSNYVEQLANMQETWNKQLRTTYTEDEVNARVKDLESMGIFGTLMSLAKKDFEKYDKLFARKWSEILLLLLLNKKENEYSRRYQKIITKRKPK